MAGAEVVCEGRGGENNGGEGRDVLSCTTQVVAGSGGGGRRIRGAGHVGY